MSSTARETILSALAAHDRYAPPPTSTPIPLEARFPVCDPMLPGGTVCRPERPATTATPYPECEDGFYPVVCTVPLHRFDSADMETG